MAKLDEKKTTFVPYGADTKFYVNLGKKTAVPVWTDRRDYNKGWHDVFVGDYAAKAHHNDVLATQLELLHKYYPGNTVERSFYADLSYHSGINQGDAGKVDVYGGDPHMVQFSRYTPAGKFKLLHPVKDSAPSSFGKERKSVTAYDWEYIVVNSAPTSQKDVIDWQVAHTIKRADGKEDVLYTSPSTKDADAALAEFNAQLANAGVKPYHLRKNLEDDFTRKYDRLNKASEGKIKIRRTTGRKGVRAHRESPGTSLGGVR